MRIEDYLNWAHVIVIPGLIYVGKLVHDIRNDIRAVSDRVIDNTRWIQDHDVRDNERFAQLHKEVDRIANGSYRHPPT